MKNQYLDNNELIKALANRGITLSRERLRHFRGYKRAGKPVPGELERGTHWDYENGKVVWFEAGIIAILKRYGYGVYPGECPGEFPK